jgi:hypothetical protein
VASVHALNLTVRPGMLGLCEAVIDTVCGTGRASEGRFAGAITRADTVLKHAPRPFHLLPSMISWAAEQMLSGVVKWVSLSVRTVWISALVVAGRSDGKSPPR